MKTKKIFLNLLVTSTLLSVAAPLVIRRFGTAGAISSKVIDTALNYSSPGTMIAKYWDRHDAYPNNGRINFW